MAFIETTTNSIVIDAVLTKRGRLLLASGVAAFQITKFGLADDEMDYTVLNLEYLLTNTPQLYPILLPTINGLLMLNSQLYTDASIAAGNKQVTVIEIPGLLLTPEINTFSSGVTVTYYPVSTGRTSETYDVTITSTGNVALNTLFTEITGQGGTGRNAGLNGTTTTLYAVSAFTLKFKSLAAAAAFGIKVKGNVTSVSQNYSCNINPDPNYANSAI